MSSLNNFHNISINPIKARVNAISPQDNIIIIGIYFRVICFSARDKCGQLKGKQGYRRFQLREKGKSAVSPFDMVKQQFFLV
jgi:hypothetical protein